MRKAPNRLRFAKELLLAVFAEALQKRFQSDGAANEGIARLVDPASPAATESLNDFVPASLERRAHAERSNRVARSRKLVCCACTGAAILRRASGYNSVASRSDGLITMRRIFFQSLRNNRVERCRNGRICLRDGKRLRGKHSRADSLQRIGIKRALARHHLVENHAKRENVGARVLRTSQNLFWAPVSRECRAAACPSCRGWRDAPCRSR